MVRTILAAVLVCGLAAAVPAAQPPGKEDKKAAAAPAGDRAAKFVATLRGQKVTYDKNVADTPLFELLQDLGKRYDLTFVVAEEAFKAEGLDNIRDAKPNLTATKVEGLSLHRFLTAALRSVDAVYLVRADHIEVTTKAAARKEAGLEEAAMAAQNNADDPNATARAEYRLGLPLVCVVAGDRPLLEVVADLARDYDLNVAIHPAVREQMRTVKVTERLLNVPADDALEVLAALVDQPVTRKGNTFRIGLGGPGL